MAPFTWKPIFERIDLAEAHSSTSTPRWSAREKEPCNGRAGSPHLLALSSPPPAAVIAATTAIARALEGPRPHRVDDRRAQPAWLPDLTSSVGADLGALASKIAYERWSDTTTGDEFSELEGQTA